MYIILLSNYFSLHKHTLNYVLFTDPLQQSCGCSTNSLARHVKQDNENSAEERVMCEYVCFS